jgi:glycosyltransferase involved in cell wall biosynthesis
VLAHQEERRIADCLNGLPLGRSDVLIHVAVNGSSDASASIARAIAERAGNIVVHEWSDGGKSKSWNRLLLDSMQAIGTTHIMVDGDAIVAPGSIDALVAAMQANPHADIVSALPGNGRRAQFYQRNMAAEHGLFGDLYAIRGTFIERLRETGVRLPEDLVGDDGLIGALAKIRLGKLSAWDEDRIVTCHAASFYCEPATVWRWQTIMNQFRRMVSYSVRHFQNQIITSILRDAGAAGLPRYLANQYPEWLDRLSPRRTPKWFWFDHLALARMRRDAAACLALRAPYRARTA